MVGWGVGLTPEIGLLRRPSWRSHRRRQHTRSRYARGRMHRRGLSQVTSERLMPEPKRPISSHRTVSGGGRRTRDNHRTPHRGMGVGPLHSIGEVAEGNEVMERRERQEGITTEQAKGRTLRWHPLLPNLRRVNDAARRGSQHCCITSTLPRSNGRSGGSDGPPAPGSTG